MGSCGPDIQAANGTSYQKTDAGIKFAELGLHPLGLPTTNPAQVPVKMSNAIRKQTGVLTLSSILLQDESHDSTHHRVRTFPPFRLFTFPCCHLVTSGQL